MVSFIHSLLGMPDDVMGLSVTLVMTPGSVEEGGGGRSCLSVSVWVGQWEGEWGVSGRVSGGSVGGWVGGSVGEWVGGQWAGG